MHTHREAPPIRAQPVGCTRGWAAQALRLLLDLGPGRSQRPGPGGVLPSRGSSSNAQAPRFSSQTPPTPGVSLCLQPSSSWAAPSLIWVQNPLLRGVLDGPCPLPSPCLSASSRGCHSWMLCRLLVHFSPCVPAGGPQAGQPSRYPPPSTQAGDQRGSRRAGGSFVASCALPPPPRSPGVRWAVRLLGEGGGGSGHSELPPSAGTGSR